MTQRKQHRESTGRIPVTRIAGAILAIGGLSASVMVSGSAGAATSSVISTSQNTKLGTILVSGKTVYTLKASKTPCGARCLKVWPEVLLPKGSKKAKAGHGVNAAKLGTVKRANGALQVTYAGKPLYWFVGDKAAGQVHGNVTDTWGTWSVLVTVKPALAVPQSASGAPESPATSPSTGAPPTSTTGPPPAATPTTQAPTPAPTTTPVTAPAPTTTRAPTPPATTPAPTTTAPSSGGVSF
jgi:predicted lipoprotein with Yx(FWY)xxD motif